MSARSGGGSAEETDEIVFERLCSPERMLNTGEEESSSVDCFCFVEMGREGGGGGCQRTCQFSPASLASSRSSIFSRVLALEGLRILQESVCLHGKYIPLQLRHAPLVLSLGPLKEQVQIPVLFLNFLDFLQRWPFGKLGLKYLDLSL